jgi:hypothetical protein
MKSTSVPGTPWGKESQGDLGSGRYAVEVVVVVQEEGEEEGEEEESMQDWADVGWNRIARGLMMDMFH